MTFDHFMVGQICVQVPVAILEDYFMAFANMQVSKLWPMGLLFLFYFYFKNLWLLIYEP